MDYIKSLPLNSLPEVFGLHENADITKDNKETSEVLLWLEHRQSSLHQTIITSPPHHTITTSPPHHVQLFENILLTLPRQEKGLGEKSPSDTIHDLANDILLKLPFKFNEEEVLWRGVVWCGEVWYGVVGCGVAWCGGVWCGVVWCGVVWCGVVWCGVVWCGVVWCGGVWCGVVWCGVVWCGVVWCEDKIDAGTVILLLTLAADRA